MNFTEAIRTCFTKYADFKGGASRPEFWWFILFNVIATLALSMISPRLSNAYSLATILPVIAAGARRLHDTDRSGWWQLVNFIPFIGWIVLIVFFAQKGKQPNRYSTVSVSLL